jgi:Uma2 family endonuclease
VPEYWLGDPMTEQMRLFALRDGRYVEVEPEDGVLRSTVIPEFAVDIAALFASLDR